VISNKYIKANAAGTGLECKALTATGTIATPVTPNDGGTGMANTTGMAKASLPAAGTAGRIARVTDDVRGLWCDNGTQWWQCAPGGRSADIVAFGAVDDGVTDSRSAIQTAIDNLPSDGGIVELPATTSGFLVNSTINIPAGKTVTIQGHGRSRIISGITNSSVLFLLAGTGAELITFSDIHLVGNATTGDAISSPSTVSHRILLDSVEITGFTATGVYGINSNSDHNVLITNHSKITANANGALITDSIDRSEVVNSTIKQNAARQLLFRGHGLIMGNMFDEQNGGSTDSIVILEDFRGTVIGNKFDGRDGNQHLLEIRKDVQTQGSVGWIVTGNAFEFISTATSTTKFCILITEAARHGQFDGNRFLQRNVTNTPIRIDSVDAAGNVRDLAFGINNYQGSVNVVSFATAGDVLSILPTRGSIVAYHFNQINIGASASSNMKIGQANGPTEYDMVIDGWIVGMSFRTSTVVTGGTLTLTPSTGQPKSITSGKVARYFQSAYIDSIGAGGLLRVLLETDSGFAPTGSMDVAATVYVMHDLFDAVAP